LNTFLGTLSRTLESTATQVSSEQRRRGILQQIVNSIQNHRTRQQQEIPWDSSSSDDDDEEDDDDDARHMQRRHFMRDIIRRHYANFVDDNRRRRTLGLRTTETSTQTRSIAQYLDEEDLEDEDEFDMLEDDEGRLDPDEYEYVKTHIVHGGFGMTGLETYKRLLRAGLLNHQAMRLTRRRQDNEEQDEDFLVKILRHFIRLECNEGDLDTFMSCVPSLDRLTQLCDTIHVKTNQTKELVMKKLMIEIWNRYLKANEGPLFNDLANKLLPLAVNFYENLSQQMVDDINVECERIATELASDRFIIVHYGSSKGFAAHYSKEYRDLQNLVMCQSMSDYYN
jgi:hypothetical protein